MSSLNSSEDAPQTPPSTSSASARKRRSGLIPSVSEQDEDEYNKDEDEVVVVEEEGDEEALNIEIRDDTHFEPIRDDDDEDNGDDNGKDNGKEEVSVVPETVEAAPRDHAEIKTLTGMGKSFYTLN